MEYHTLFGTMMELKKAEVRPIKQQADRFRLPVESSTFLGACSGVSVRKSLRNLGSSK
jgi:hypothetical protein